MNRKYAAFAIAIAVLLGLQIAALLSLLSESASNELAADINMAGKQRMISQRIAFNINHMFVDKETHYAQSLDDANEYVQLFINNHKTLSTATGLSRELKQIYFHSPYNLDKKVKSFAVVVKSIIRKLIAGQEVNANSTEIEQMNVAAMDTLIGLLDMAVMQYQRDAEEKLDSIRNSIELLTLFIMLTLIIGIVTFSLMLRNLSRNERRLSINQFVFDHSIVGIITADADGTMMSINPAVRDMLSCEPGALLRKNLFALLSDMHSNKEYDIRQPQAEIQQQGSWREEILPRRKGVKPFSIGVSAVYSDSGEIINYVALLTDISIQKDSEDKYRFLSMHDTLTGLLSRMALYEAVEHEIKVCERHGRSLALMMLDLDDFKQVNDEYGHQAGDAVLKELSQRLQNTVRSSDLVARLGGDEFVLVQIEVEHFTDIEKLAEKISKEMIRPVPWHGVELHVGISIGISVYPDHAATIEELISVADKQMYQVKGSGKNNFSIHCSE